MKTELPKGLTLLCNDLGEIEEIIHDDIGLASSESSKSGKMIFLRLVTRSSLEHARAFLTDLRISRKVINKELMLQTKEGATNVYFAGAKTGNHFLIVGARNIDDKDKLYAEMLAAANDQKDQAIQTIKDHPEAERVEKKHIADLDKLTDELTHTRSQLIKKNDELERVHQDLYELATTDTMTGVYNRRHFVRRLKEELREAERYKRSHAFLMIDIDGFRQINEKYGLQVGDEILRSVGVITLGVLRKVDMVGRLGGDEFGALLVEASKENSIRIAKRLQKKLSDISIVVESRSFRITVTIALIFLMENKTTADRVMKQAEALLKQAKQNGGNQVIIGEKED